MSILTIRPNGNALCSYPFQAGDVCPDHWKNVDELKMTGTIVGSPFTIGETVTGSVSGATAIVEDEGANYIICATVVGTWVAADTAVGGVSGATINGGLTFSDDGDTTHQRSTSFPFSASPLLETYALVDSAGESGGIIQIEVFVRLRDDADATRVDSAAIGIISNGVEAVSSGFKTTGSWATYSQVFTVDPDTNAAWTFAAIDALIAGTSLSNPQRPNGSWIGKDTYISQLWVEVTFGDTAAVTTQAMSDVTLASATGNGNITSVGDGTVTGHGHVWNTTGTPDIDDFIQDDGAAGVGAYTTFLTGLASDTTYFVRAFATSEFGTVYGAQVQFTTPPTTPDEGAIPGGPATYAQHFVVVDWDDDGDFGDAESDITIDVIDADMDWGKDRELSRATAMFLTLEVKNTDHKYSPPNSSSVLNQGGRTLRPGHEIFVGMSFPYDEFKDANGVGIESHYPTVPYDPTDLWSEEAGTFIIDTNQIKETSGAGQAVMETEEADAHVVCDFKLGVNGDSIIIFRFTDTSNYLFIRFSGGLLSVQKIEGGGGAVVGTGVFTWSVGDTKTVKVILHGPSIYVLVEGVLIISTSSTFNETATKHGIGGDSIHANARYDKWGCSYNLFYGRIDNITPNTDPSVQTAYIECSDDFKQLAGTTLKRRNYPFGGWPDTLEGYIEEILKTTMVNGVSQRGFILDTGETANADGHNRSWWDIKALEACHRVERDENGFFYQDPDSLWRLENRAHRATTPHDASIKTFYAVRATNGMFFTGLKWRSGDEDIINRVVVNAHRNEIVNNINYFEEIWRAREADVVDGGIGSSLLSIGAGATKVVYFESDFETITRVQDPVSTATTYKLAGTIANGPFEIGEQVTDAGAKSGYVMSQGGGFIIISGVTGVPAGGDTWGNGGSGASINGGLTVTAVGDFVANAAADGSGADKTAQLAVTLAAVDASDVWNWGRGGKLTLVNSDGSTIYVTRLRIMADAYEKKEKIVGYAEDTTSEGNYGLRSFEVESESLVTFDEAQALADDIEVKEDDPRAKIEIVMQNSTKETLTQILARRLSDRVTLNWSDFGVNEDFYLNRKRIHIYNGGASVDCVMLLEEVS